VTSEALEERQEYLRRDQLHRKNHPDRPSHWEGDRWQKGERKEKVESTQERWWNVKTKQNEKKKLKKMVWCATVWAVQRKTNKGDDGGEGERWENGAKQIVRERRERRVRLLHTVQHARQNTTSLYTDAQTFKWYYCYFSRWENKFTKKKSFNSITPRDHLSTNLEVQGNGISAQQTIKVNTSIKISSNTQHASLWNTNLITSEAMLSKKAADYFSLFIVHWWVFLFSFKMSFWVMFTQGM